MGKTESNKNNDENKVIPNDIEETYNLSSSEIDEEIEEMERYLAKLEKITPIAFPLRVGFGPGSERTVDFKVIGPDGIGIYEGVISNWPLWKFEAIDDKLMLSIYDKAKKSLVTLEDFRNTDIFCLMLELVVRRYDLNKIILENHQIMVSDTKKSRKKSYFYVIADYQNEPKFFRKQEEMYNSFVSDYPATTDWLDVDDSYDDVLKEYKMNKGSWLFDSGIYKTFKALFEKYR